MEPEVQVQQPLTFDAATSAAIDNIANKVIAAMEKKNAAQKFDRPDGWGGVIVKYGAAAITAWAVSKGMDAAYDKIYDKS